MAHGAQQVFDRFDNPFPAPLDGPGGVFLLEAAGWLLLGVLAMLVIAPALKRLARVIPTDIDQHIVGITSRPGVILIFAYGLFDSVQVFHLPAWAERWNNIVWSVVLIAMVTYMVYRLWREVLLSVGRKVSAKTETQLDDKLYPLFSKLGGLIILFVGLWLVVASFGIDMTLFAAGSAIGGLVIAFAAQDTLGNLFAGVFIMLDQPFREGDRIEIKEENTWGDVVDIGLRTTKIRTRDNRMVVVPNSLIGGNPVINHSIPDTTYRLATNVGVAYGSDIEVARQAMLDACATVEGVLSDQKMEALFLGFGDSSLNFMVRCWMPHYAERRRFMDKLNTAIFHELAKAGIEIPFPQRVVHLHNP